MRPTWPKVPLSEVVQLQRRWIKLHPTETYREIGIRSFGKGIFHKAPIAGNTLGNKRVLRIEPGDLVFNNVFAWEGAVAVAGPNEAGMIGSHRFVTYTVDPAKGTAEFLKLFFATPSGRELLLKASPGSAGRNKTLGLDRFISQSIPLPPFAEQRRVVARIEELAAQIHEARALRQQAAVEAESLALHISAGRFSGASGSVVGDFICLQTGYAFKSEWFTEAGTRLARNANVGHGTLDWSETVRIPEERRADFPRFELRPGDILISLDRPIISTGVKVARVRNDDLPCLLLQRVARAQFLNSSVLPEYFYQWLRSIHFVNAIDPGRSNGVPHISHKDIEKIAFAPPPLSEQRRILGELDALQSELNGLKSLQAETAAELDALLPSILARAFNGELYHRSLEPGFSRSGFLCLIPADAPGC